MNDKVKELVEWVADKIFLSAQRLVCLDVCGECCNFDNDECQHENAVGGWDDMVECPQDRLVANTLAKQILSHPDLALIDRGKKPPNAKYANDFGNEKSASVLKYEYGCLGFTHSIIPLAEALKEAKDADKDK